MIDVPVLIVGAGPAGLALGACLRQNGTDFVILEQSDAVGSSWRQHYERLHLHTDKAHSSLPWMKLPRHYPRYPSRAQIVTYLEDYAQRFQLAPLFGQRVTRAWRDADHSWHVATTDSHYRARTLVVAGGVNREPQRPQWPGMDTYTGALLHSASYRSGASYRGQKVLVVGLGNSGGEIAIDLHEHGAQPTLAVRSPVNVIPREVLGTPFLTIGILQQCLPARLADAFNAPLSRLLIGDLRPYGLRKPALGPVAQIRREGRVPFIDVGTIALIKQGHIQVRPGIERFTPTGVVFTDGRTEDVDAVVLATGYKPGLQSWLQAGAGVLDDEGRPTSSGEPTAEPGLYFCGYRISATGMLREIGLEALALSRLIAALSSTSA
jgi:indole-3-pyruvate monooxygenase